MKPYVRMSQFLELKIIRYLTAKHIVVIKAYLAHELFEIFNYPSFAQNPVDPTEHTEPNVCY